MAGLLTRTTAALTAVIADLERMGAAPEGNPALAQAITARDEAQAALDASAARKAAYEAQADEEDAPDHP